MIKAIPYRLSTKPFTTPNSSKATPTDEATQNIKLTANPIKQEITAHHKTSQEPLFTVKRIHGLIQYILHFPQNMVIVFKNSPRFL